VTRSYIDKNEAVAALRSTVPDVVAAIRNINNPDAPAIGSWTAGDVAAHLIDVAEDNRNVARGEGTRYPTTDDVAAINQERLARRHERDPRVLAERYETSMTTYLDELERVEGDPVIPWADFEIPLSAQLAADISECLIHGWDITQAEGRPWRIDPASAGLSAKGLAPFMIQYVDPQAAAGFTGTFEIRLRGQWILHYVFTDGRLSIHEPAGRRVDVRISADPVGYLLVGYGRVSQWGPALKGQMLAWGRKPWLAFKFATLLRNP